jgi:hypothetical protein
MGQDGQDAAQERKIVCADLSDEEAANVHHVYKLIKMMSKWYRLNLQNAYLSKNQAPIIA